MSVPSLPLPVLLPAPRHAPVPPDVAAALAEVRATNWNFADARDAGLRLAAHPDPRVPEALARRIAETKALTPGLPRLPPYVLACYDRALTEARAADVLWTPLLDALDGFDLWRKAAAERAGRPSVAASTIADRFPGPDAYAAALQAAIAVAAGPDAVDLRPLLAFTSPRVRVAIAAGAAHFPPVLLDALADQGVEVALLGNPALPPATAAQLARDAAGIALAPMPVRRSRLEDDGYHVSPRLAAEEREIRVAAEAMLLAAVRGPHGLPADVRARCLATALAEHAVVGEAGLEPGGPAGALWVAAHDRTLTHAEATALLARAPFRVVPVLLDQPALSDAERREVLARPAWNSVGANLPCALVDRQPPVDGALLSLAMERLAAAPGYLAKACAHPAATPAHWRQAVALNRTATLFKSLAQHPAARHDPVVRAALRRSTAWAVLVALATDGDARDLTRGVEASLKADEPLAALELLERDPLPAGFRAPTAALLALLKADAPKVRRRAQALLHRVCAVAPAPTDPVIASTPAVHPPAAEPRPACRRARAAR